MKMFIFLPFIVLLVSMVFVLKVTTILETFVFANLDGVKKLAINVYLIGNVQIKLLGTIHLLRWHKNWMGPENGQVCYHYSKVYIIRPGCFRLLEFEKR